MEKKELLIIDPYNWWPNSYDLFQGFKNNNINFTFLTNFDDEDISAIKAFNQKNFILKAWECFYKIPLQVIKNRNKTVIIMWLPLPFFNHISLAMLKLIGFKHFIWVHNSIPHSLARYHKYIEKLSIIFWPIIGNVITMNKDFYEKIRHTNHANFFIPPPVSIKDSKSKLNKKYTFGLIGRFESYKYPKNFINDLEKFCIKNDLKVLACGKNALDYVQPGLVFDVYDGFIPTQEYNSLIRDTKIILCPYIYIDMSGVIMTCIEENIFWYSNSVGQIKYLEGFNFCHEEIKNFTSFITNALDSYNKNHDSYSKSSKSYVQEHNWEASSIKIKKNVS